MIKIMIITIIIITIIAVVVVVVLVVIIVIIIVNLIYFNPFMPSALKRNIGFVSVEALRPSQPNRVMSSAVSLPNHTFTG